MATQITKNDFMAYLRVQRSGKTNMFDVRTVKDLSGLSRSKILEIMKNYSKYKNHYE